MVSSRGHKWHEYKLLFSVKNMRFMLWVLFSVVKKVSELEMELFFRMSIPRFMLNNPKVMLQSYNLQQLM